MMDKTTFQNHRRGMVRDGDPVECLRFAANSTSQLNEKDKARMSQPWVCLWSYTWDIYP